MSFINYKKDGDAHDLKLVIIPHCLCVLKPRRSECIAFNK